MCSESYLGLRPQRRCCLQPSDRHLSVMKSSEFGTRKRNQRYLEDASNSGLRLSAYKALLSTKVFAEKCLVLAVAAD